MNLLVWFKDLFIPHSRNNHKAKILHPRFLTIIVGFFLVSQFGLNYFTLSSPSILGFASDISSDQVIDLVNQQRLNDGLRPLIVSISLNEAAQRKAIDMFAFDYWAHTSPAGRTPWSFFKEVGYKYLYAGENLARDFMDSNSTVEAWMSSPSHRENILNPHYQEIGLAVVNGVLNGVETTLVVQVFGTPTPAPVLSSTKKNILPKSQLGGANMVVAAETGFLEANQNSDRLISPFSLTKVVAVFLLCLISGGLLLDALFVAKKKVVRLSSRNLAHLIFVLFLLLAALISNPGLIL